MLTHVQHFATPWNCSLPGSSVHGILWARILQWVAIPSSTRSLEPVSLMSPALAGSFFTTNATWEAPYLYLHAHVYIFIFGCSGFHPCSMEDLSSWCSGSIVYGLNSCPMAHGILVPWAGIEPASPALEGGFLTTGPPRKSVGDASLYSFCHFFA